MQNLGDHPKAAIGYHFKTGHRETASDISSDGGKLASVGMGNVLEKAKQEQVNALGRLGWSLRRIEAATGVRRETAGGYLRSAGIALRTPGGWGRKAPAKAATSVTTGSASSKPANEVITGFSPSRQAEDAKPANEVITGFLPEMRLPEQGGKRPCGASEAYRELIE